MAVLGTELSVTTVRFQEAEFHWPLFGNEFEEVTVASVPISAGRISPNRQVSESVFCELECYERSAL